MKKIFTLCAAAALAVSASAQTVTESKTFDNWYIGVNGGIATGIHPSVMGSEGHTWAKDITPNAGIRVGRYFTPVFGLAVESNVYFSDLHHAGRSMNSLFGSYTNTLVNSINTSLIGTVNFSNWFGGYKGAPRLFEVSAVYGLGWGHVFDGKSGDYYANDWKESGKTDFLTSKAGLDFAFNLGKAKAWQVYIEPSVIWNLEGTPRKGVRYDAKYADFQLNAGVVYKFKNSNGTHNFTVAQLRDQAEIDGLNAKINDLRNDLNGKDSELAAKNKKIADLQNALDECNKTPKYVKPETATNLQPTVIFRQGKSTVDNSQLANIELIAQYMKNHKDASVEIKGYASPEGSKELNQALSEKRAEAVKNILVKKYKISADRLTTKGMGATDKLFEQVEFNRVATFNDSTK